jgi:hypothetical protein
MIRPSCGELESSIVHRVWSTHNRTPYAVASTWGRTKDGVHEWIVAVRASFDIGLGGQVTLADEQPEPLLVAEYHGEEGASSLRYETDLVSPKPTTDILVNGTAYAPRGRPATEFPVSLRVDGLEKVLRVRGDRVYSRSAGAIEPSAAAPVTEVPIRYERAFGGFDNADPNPMNQKMDPRNPIGCGIAADPRRLIDKPVHNFEYANRPPAESGPAGFGAIASYWSPRRELSGTYDAAWEESRKPLLAVDWDPASLLCSPTDQRPQQPLRGGERVQLSNLTRDGFLQFDLPKIYPIFTTYFSTVSGRRLEEHRARLATAILEPDRARLALVWTTALLVHGDEDYLDETVVREKTYISW